MNRTLRPQGDNDNAGFVLAVKLTIAVAIAIVLVALLSEALAAGAPEVEYVGRAEAAELYEMARDESVTPACRIYADLVLTGQVLITVGHEYPELVGPQLLFEHVLESLPTASFDCEVSV